MQLTDVNITSTSKIAKLNKFLSEQYKFEIDVGSPTKDLLSLSNKTNDLLRYLREEKALSPKDAEYVKCISILEAIDIILTERDRIDEDFDAGLSVFERMLAEFYPIIDKWYNRLVPLGSCLDMAMREYRASPFVLDDEDVREALEHHWHEENPGSDPDHINGFMDHQHKLDFRVVKEPQRELDLEANDENGIPILDTPINPNIPTLTNPIVPPTMKAGDAKAKFKIDTSDRPPQFDGGVATVPKLKRRNSMLFNGALRMSESGKRGNILFAINEGSSVYRAKFIIENDGIKLAGITTKDGSDATSNLMLEEQNQLCEEINALIITKR